MVCNWKAYLSISKSIKLAVALSKWSKLNNLAPDIIIAPSHESLYPVSKILDGTRISLCAQNMNIDKQGAYTGAVSTEVLDEIDCKYVILGHSEIRSGISLGIAETDKIIANKFGACMLGKLNPILCIGETLEERKKGKTYDVLKRQLLRDMGEMPNSLPKVKRIYVAYEPVWAISSNRPSAKPIPDEINGTVVKLRILVEKEFGNKVSAQTKFLYGGSVDSTNIASYASQSDIDGVLIGGMSTNFSKLTNMLKKLENK